MDTFEHDGLRFEVSADGPADGPLVILLHGFPGDRSGWAGVSPALAAAGHRTLAPDQRGYSPGARPPRRRDYTLDRLAADVLALADRAGAPRFDLVGHDWGATVSWYLAARYPDRVRSLVALSVPHTNAVAQALRRGGQALRSWYVAAFQVPVLPERVLAVNGGDRLRSWLVRGGLDDPHARAYAARAASPAAMTGPLNWYRAIPFALRDPLPPVTVPTVFGWGDRDRYIARATAEGCGQWVTGPFRYEVFERGTHWLPEREPDRVAALVADHLRSVADPAR